MSTTPLTLSLSDSDETRGRLWAWFVRLGIGIPKQHAYPGWIPEHQAQCCAAERVLAAVLQERYLGILDEVDRVHLRSANVPTPQGEPRPMIQERSSPAARWRNLLSVRDWRIFAAQERNASD